MSPDDIPETQRDVALNAAQSAGERLARHHLQQMQMITEGYRMLAAISGIEWPEALSAFWSSYLGYLIGHMHGALGVEVTRALLNQITEDWERRHVN